MSTTNRMIDEILANSQDVPAQMKKLFVIIAEMGEIVQAGPPTNPYEFQERVKVIGRLCKQLPEALDEAWTGPDRNEHLTGSLPLVHWLLSGISQTLPRIPGSGDTQNILHAQYTATRKELARRHMLCASCGQWLPTNQDNHCVICEETEDEKQSAKN